MISVVIAAYNEEKRIGSSLLRISDYLTGESIDHEIIVVDDGSVDGTSRTVNDLATRLPRLRLIRYEKNMGKGYALRTGVLQTTGDLVLVSDADLSTPVEELTKLWAPIAANDSQLAIGSRALARSMLIKKQPWWRQGMGRVFNRIVQLIIMDDFSDTQCGFKLFGGDIARRLFMAARINRFAYDVEILALAKKQGYRIAEIPIRWINAPGSKVNPVFDSIQMLLDLLKIKAMVGSVRSDLVSVGLRPKPVHH
jgi:dolichyl-phosphate beta-glucosyltransferase